ncbi:MAG: hypothetical protein ABIR78_03640 [Ferruginibacter sp.]
MKKLLLSSIIMFGICGFVTAQNATDSKLKKAGTTTSSVAPTPQKSAVAAPALATNPDAKPASDKVNAPAAVAPTGKFARVAKTDATATAISADGSVVPATDDMQKKEAVKSVAPVKKN